MALSLVLGGVCSFAGTSARAASYSPETAGRRVVGYLPSYRTYAIDSIDFSALTHCNLSFMTYANGYVSLGFSSSDVTNIVNKCHANNVKAIIALGGWGGFTNDGAFTTSAKRSSIVNQIMNYVNTYNLDGVDIDIELGDADIWANYDAFISELSGRLKANGKLLTMAVSPWFTGSIANSTYNYFDFLNLMTYDYSQNGGDVAPWSQVYDNINYYSQRGVSNDRLVIGVPFYGYDSTGTAYTYSQIISMNPGAANSDYYNGIAYNGASTIQAKAEYAKNYGGIMMWELAQDSFGQYSLLSIIKNTMSAGLNNGGGNNGGGNNTSSGEIYIYQDINYGGRSASLGLGDYNLSSLVAKGFKNDDLSSIKVPLGYKVILYADDNFSGATKVVTGDTSWIGSDFNDKVSSIKVIKAQYRFVNRNSGLALDIDGASTANGANVQQWTINGTVAQGFELTANSDGTYSILSIMHGKSFDVAEWSNENGGNIQIWDNASTDNQKWYINDAGNGYVYITSKFSGKCLDAEGWYTHAGGNVHQWDYLGNANQQWKMEIIN
ncbi:MAG: RICIN domain-containing protein [Lachnospiraceae bacterium]|nr:RICIN domain-containing protein [Lachnospiraceae bacterium]